MKGVIVPAGGGRKLVTKALQVTYKATGDQGSFASIFEGLVPPGFDAGAHIHDQAEFFYVLEGELDMFAFEPVVRAGDRWLDWEAADGARVVHASAGSCMFVPGGCPHAFTNRSGKPARLLAQTFPPPEHERYFQELCEIFAQGPAADPDAIQQLRDRYRITEITPVRYEPPVPAPR
jgi:mannose-6-phosphate isomerase-like protein (cupin superfamily)